MKNLVLELGKAVRVRCGNTDIVIQNSPERTVGFGDKEPAQILFYIHNRETNESTRILDTVEVLRLCANQSEG